VRDDQVRVDRRRGHVRIQLAAVESGLLATLFDDLTGALDLLPEGDPVRERLFPSAYPQDDEAASEFRELTESALRDTRVDRLDLCRSELPAAEGQVDLDHEAAQRWLAALNDLRLAIGTRLDVSEDDDPGIDPADPDAPSRAIYHWLTAMQDSLVHAVAG
jgi:hypothetical protein